MKLKNEGAANSKISVRDAGILTVNAEGIVEVDDQGVADRLVSAGWKLIKASNAKVGILAVNAEPKVEEPKVEPKVEAAPKTEPKAEPKVEAEEPKTKSKKSTGYKRERPTFKRKGE